MTEVSSGGRAGATLVTSQGTLAADLVVAADGLGSGLRARCFPSWPGPRYAGYTAGRLLPRVDAKLAADCQFETWGRGERFSALQMRHGEVYAWATATAPAGQRAVDEKAELLRRFASWHDPIPALIEAALPSTVLRHDVYALPRVLLALHAGRVAFVGDAAHAMTPDLGQGGCTAIEDAAVLAHTVGETPSAEIGEALPGYTAQRRARVATIHRRSQQFGRVGQVSKPLRVALRGAALRAAALIPEGAILRSLEPIAGWSPP